ncbi:hypothetical protein [Spirosoma fluviale]|uniref:Uncharacterized protein n=1 Tax=Spirosoma fluviale TaxID=1597977 RepID=A0A286GRQ5_9BACT|nr:hypothetical protein [Spirosoma fluviale]SOD97624.1 hypothetical protein SAMN06269250_5862 [Spirosoma fluviale]
MKNILLFLTIFLTSCESEPAFEYYTSPDKISSVTLVRYEGRVYFTKGNYSRREVPQSFIWPISGIDNAYLCYIHWCGEDGIEILSPYGEWLDTEKDSKLKFRKIDDVEANAIRQNKTDKYVYCYGNIAP